MSNLLLPTSVQRSRGRFPAPAVGSTPAAAFSDGYDKFGLEGDESFSTSSPALKDGTAITGDGLTYYDATMYWAQATGLSGDWVFVDIESRLGFDDSYQVARAGQACVDSMMQAFRLTGDLRILDRLVDGYNAMVATAFQTNWNGHDCALIDAESDQWCGSMVGDPWTPHGEMLLYRNSLYWGTGTNVDELQQTKIYAKMVKFAWALHLNRAKTSPAGHDYDALATAWGQRIENFVDTWSGSGTEDWRDNYHGDEYTNPGSAGVRPAFGSYPLVVNDGSHTAFSGVEQTYYLGRLADTGLWNIINGSAALTKARDIAQTLRNNMIDCTAPYGDTIVNTRNNMYSGGEPEVGAATYSNYIAMYLTEWWLSGYFRDIWSQTDLQKLSRAYAEMHNADGSTGPNLLDGANKCGLTGSGGATRSVRQQSINGYANMLIFAGSSEPILDDAATDCQTNDAGGYTTPDSGILPSAQFTSWALRTVGDVTV